MSAYYNEIDPHAAAWLRELIKEGLIAPGDVDTRSIEDVRPRDLLGYKQCHFFAGIGVWSYALRLAGWSDDQEIWTGSCPCQPFSQAGQELGFADERHLWPFFFWLIQQCQPAIIAGEQVASSSANPWIDLVQVDLEALGYAFGCVPFPSAGIGAPHIRDRAYWLADSGGQGLEKRERDGGIQCGALGALAGQPTIGSFDFGRMADSHRNGSFTRQRNGSPARYGDATSATGGNDRHGCTGPTNGMWSDADWISCRDGKWRPVEPSTFPLANGSPARVGRLRGYGNAINAEQAAEFIRASIEAIDEYDLI